jgi:hypothetical protein
MCSLQSISARIGDAIAHIGDTNGIAQLTTVRTVEGTSMVHPG